MDRPGRLAARLGRLFGHEILKLPGGIVQVQTPTANLEWALPDRYQSAAVARLKVAHWVPVEDTAE